MRDHEARVDLASLDLLQQRLGVGLHMGLAHLEGQALGHCGADRELVAHADIDARNRDRAALAAAEDRFPQDMHPVGGEHRDRLHLVENRVRGTVTGGFAADRVDAAVRAAIVGPRHQFVVDINLREIDRLGPARLGHGQALGHFVDRDHPAGAHHQRRADGKLANRPATPDRDGIAIFDLCVLGGHVAGREDVGKEKRLLVRDAVRDLDRPDVGHRHPQILGLTAAVATEHVAEAEEPGRRMAHRLDRHLGVGIGPIASREHAPLAEPALPAADREGHDHPVADFEIRDLRTKLDDLAHVFMAEDVAAFHRRLVAIEEMQVGAADRAGGDLDHRVTRVLDFRIRDGVDADVTLPVPAKCTHGRSSLLAEEHRMPRG